MRVVHVHGLAAAAAFALLAVLAVSAPVARASEAAAGGAEQAVDWKHWQADVEINNIASLQRGARNYMAYCSGCHSIKYMRYSRLAADLKIPERQLEQHLLLPGDSKNDYILTRLQPADGESWFGKAPPDLSLITRAKGEDYVFQFLKTFYSEPGAPTGVNNLALPGTAMPHVLSDLQGVQRAVFRNVEQPGEDGKPRPEAVFFKFETAEPGRLSAADYDGFVRDTVNFLSYVGEPSQAKRQSLGVWVILFLLAFTAIAYLLYVEYWKDVPPNRE